MGSKRRSYMLSCRNIYLYLFVYEVFNINLIRKVVWEINICIYVCVYKFDNQSSYFYFQNTAVCNENYVCTVLKNIFLYFQLSKNISIIMLSLNICICFITAMPDFLTELTKYFCRNASYLTFERIDFEEVYFYP